MAKTFHANAVAMNTPTTGTGTFTVSTVLDIAHITAAQAGVVDGRPYAYKITDGNDIEFGSGVAGSTATTFTRVLKFSKIGGVYSTVNKINLSGNAIFRLIESAEDIDGKAETDNPNIFTATQTFNVAPVLIDQPGSRAAAYAAPFDALAYDGMQINGSVDWSQELGTAQTTMSLAAVKVMTDGFSGFYNHAANTAVLKFQQVTPPGSPSFQTAFSNCLQLTSTTALGAPGANDRALFWQVIEGTRWARLGFGGSNAQSVTIGFWVYATIAGTMTVALGNSAATRAYLANVTINNATTWEYKTITIPGDTTGTWLTTIGQGALIYFTFCAGSTFQGAANTWNTANVDGTSSTTNFFASNGNTVCLTGLIVVPGTEAPSAARSPFIMRPSGQELQNCQRYFQKTFPQTVACAQNAGVAGALTVKNPIALGDPSEYWQFFPRMRAAPTITTYNPSAANANWRDITAASDVTVSIDPGGTLGDGGVLLATSGTVAALGDILAIHVSADSRL